MGALLPLLLGPGGEHSKGHCCRCLQMFADVLLALVVELVTLVGSEDTAALGSPRAWAQGGPAAMGDTARWPDQAHVPRPVPRAASAYS